MQGSSALPYRVARFIDAVESAAYVTLASEGGDGAAAGARDPGAWPNPPSLPER